MKLNPFPRLYVTAAQLDRLKTSPRVPLLRAAQGRLEAMAEAFVGSPKFDWELRTHNAHLLRARQMQTRVVTLLARWWQTGDERFRRATLEHVREMGGWEYWSWITWRQGNAEAEAIFDLSYGENSATLAIARDWLGDTLTDDERQELREIALRRSLRPLLVQTEVHDGKRGAWWFGHATSNWNTVCAGGAGMLALALYEELPEAREALQRVEQSVKPYFASLDELGGAWPEGIGYWNYGMRYGFMYLLSHERATGRRHPLLRSRGVRQTLRFPLDFAPHGIGCSFGDVNQWQPLPFHYAVAEQLGLDELIGRLDRAQRPVGTAESPSSWPTAAELRIMHPGRRAAGKSGERNVSRLYKGQDWAVLADRLPDSRLYLSIRGGTTDVPHGHRDLTSYHCVVGDEAMIPSLGVREYLDTTFSSRRPELPETMPVTKNVVLINGVGVADHSRVKISPLTAGRWRGYRIDATAAMGEMRDGPVARFCGRVLLVLGDRAVLVVDSVHLPHAGRIESRLHTFAAVETDGASADLRGERQRVRIAWAANVPSVLLQSQDSPTTPGPGATRLRWCTERLHERMVMATLIAPGGTKAQVELEVSPRGGIVVKCAGRGFRETVRLTGVLRK